MAKHAQDGYYSPHQEQFEEFELLKAEESAEKPAYSKVIVALCLVTVIAYTVTCLFYLWNGKPLNDTLTILFFGCFGLEFASLAFIQRGKLKYAGGNAGNKQLPHIEIEEEEDDSEADK